MFNNKTFNNDPAVLVYRGDVDFYNEDAELVKDFLKIDNDNIDSYGTFNKGVWDSVNWAEFPTQIVPADEYFSQENTVVLNPVQTQSGSSNNFSRIVKFALSIAITVAITATLTLHITNFLTLNNDNHSKKSSCPFIQIMGDCNINQIDKVDGDIFLQK